jgi:hypothetical protein
MGVKIAHLFKENNGLGLVSSFFELYFSQYNWTQIQTNLLKATP